MKLPIMKAAYFKNHGGLDNLQIGEVEQPQLKSNELLVETAYAALNHLDLFVLEGWPGLNLHIPHILGSDGSGVVKEIGGEIDAFKVGDKVLINPGISCGKCNYCLAGQQNLCADFSIKGEHFDGTFAEFFTIPEKNVLKIPDSISLKDAAAAPLTFLTAWRMMVTRAEVRPEEYVFIHGAGGGVSSAAIQIAKMLGAIVIATTSSEEKMKAAQDLGADHVINYKERNDFTDYVYKEITGKRGVDVVIDSVGKQTFPKSIKLLRPNGRFVTCGATTGPHVDLDIRHVFWKQLQILGSTMSNQKEFRDVMNIVFEGKIHPVVDKVFPLDQVKEAEKYLKKGNQFGKVLLSVNP